MAFEGVLPVVHLPGDALRPPGRTLDAVEATTFDGLFERLAASGVPRFIGLPTARRTPGSQGGDA